MSKSRKKRERRWRSQEAVAVPDAAPPADVESVSPAVEWSVLPLSREPGRLAVAVLLIFAAGAGAVYWFESVAYSVAAAAIVALAVLPFLLRTHYRLSAEEIEVRTALYSFRRPLSSYRSFELAGNRAWLCTRRRRELIDNYRGMLVLLGDRAEDVRAALVSAGLAERGRPALQGDDVVPSPPAPLPGERGARAQRGRGEGDADAAAPPEERPNGRSAGADRESGVLSDG